MFIRLFILFTAVPLMELWLLIKVGEVIGASSTLLVVIITGAAGAFLARQQGLAVITQFQRQVESQQMPTDTLIEGLLVLVGGVLLVTPGIATDIAGFCLVIPYTRRAIRNALKRSVLSKMTMIHNAGYRQGHWGADSRGQGAGDRTHNNDDDVIDV